MTLFWIWLVGYVICVLGSYIAAWLRIPTDWEMEWLGEDVQEKHIAWAIINNTSWLWALIWPVWLVLAVVMWLGGVYG